MKTTPEKTPRENLLDTADGVSRGLRASFRHVATGGEADSVIHQLAIAGAMIFELCDELRRPSFGAMQALALEDDARDAAPLPAPGAKCRHEWDRTVAPPVCTKCGKPKSAQGRPKGPPVATVAGVTKQDPSSLPLREALPSAQLEPFVPVRR